MVKRAHQTLLIRAFSTRGRYHATRTIRMSGAMLIRQMSHSTCICGSFSEWRTLARRELGGHTK